MYGYIYHIALKIEIIYVLIITMQKLNKTRTNIYYSKPIITTKNFNLPENKSEFINDKIFGITRYLLKSIFVLTIQVFENLNRLGYINISPLNNLLKCTIFFTP